MRIYFDIIFIVLNIIIFAVNFHFALESKSSKAYTYAILGMRFCHCSHHPTSICGFKSRIIMKKSVENTQYKTENCRPNNSDLSF
mgnify:FL=1